MEFIKKLFFAATHRGDIRERESKSTQSNFPLKTLFSFLFSIFLFFLAHSSVYAATYYVSVADGNDSNCTGLASTPYTSGSNQPCPWQTAGKVSGSSFSPGDSILFKYGEIWAEGLTLPSSGTNGLPITLDAYGNSGLNKPEFLGLDTITGWALDSGSIYKVSDNFNLTSITQTFQDNVRLITETSKGAMVAGSFFMDEINHFLYVWTTDSANPSTHTIQFTHRRWGLQSNGKGYWTINNLWFTGFAGSGFNFRDVTGTNNFTLNNDISSWNAIRGFDEGGGPSTAKNDITINNSTANDNIGEGFWLGYNSSNLGLNSVTSYNNGKENVSKNYNTAVAGSNLTISDNCTNCFIKNSHSYNGYGGAATVDVETEAGFNAPTGTIIDGNLFEASQTASKDIARDLAVGTIWRNNIFIGGNGGILIRLQTNPGANAASGAQLLHNTFYQNQSGVEAIFVNTMTGIIVKDNIIDGTGGGFAFIVVAAGQTGFVSDYNVWVGGSSEWGSTFYNFANWKINSGQDAHSVNSDPKLVNPGSTDYHLQSSSPAIKVGVNVGVTTDYAGSLRPYSSAPDMGAYQYSAAPTAPSSLSQYKSDGTTSISSGGNTNETSVVLKYSMSSTNASDTLTPQVEVQAIGTAFTNIPTATGSAVLASGSPVTGSVTVTGLTNGITYHWQANLTNSSGDGTWTSMGGNPDFGVNTSATSSSSSPSSNYSSSSPNSGCGEAAGPGAPNLFEIRTTKNSATLYFAPPVMPYSNFYIAYSGNPNTWDYGTQHNQGYSGGVLSYTVYLLQPNTKYYFKIRSGNGCATGGWGNTMTANTTSSKSFTTFYKNIVSNTVLKTPINLTSNNSISVPKTKTIVPAQTVIPTIMPIQTQPITPSQPPPPPQTQSAPKSKFCFLWWCF